MFAKFDGKFFGILSALYALDVPLGTDKDFQASFFSILPIKVIDPHGRNNEKAVC